MNYVLILFFVLASYVNGAFAQEAQPGDTCSGAGMLRQTGGPEQIPARNLVCDGSQWRTVTEVGTSGRQSFQVDNDTTICTANKTGRLRYDNANDVWEYCTGAAWKSMSATNGYEYAGGTTPYVMMSNNLDAAYGVFEDTYDPWPDEHLPMIGLTSSGASFIGSMSDQSSIITGMWQEDYDMYIGQVYGMDSFSSGLGDFSGIKMRDQDNLKIVIFGQELFSVGWSGVTLNSGVTGSATTINGRVKMSLNSAAPATCVAARVGTLAMTSSGTLCTCTSSNVWRNAANTANCSW